MQEDKVLKWLLDIQKAIAMRHIPLLHAEITYHLSQRTP